MCSREERTIGVFKLRTECLSQQRPCKGNNKSDFRFKQKVNKMTDELKGIKNLYIFTFEDIPMQRTMKHIELAAETGWRVAALNALCASNPYAVLEQTGI